MDVPSAYDQILQAYADKEGRTLLAHNRFAEFVLLQVDNTRALALLDDTRSLELANSLSHALLADLALARILIEVDVQALILLRVFPDGKLSPHTPVLQRALVTVLHSAEVFCSLDLDLWVIFSVLVNFDIDIEKMFDGVRLEFLLRTVFLITNCNETKL